MAPMPPSAFISYSWDNDAHKEWVWSLAVRLRADGADVTLDRWLRFQETSFPPFMETAIRENQFIVIICTPHYKDRSDARECGVGYEGKSNASTAKHSSWRSPRPIGDTASGFTTRTNSARRQAERKRAPKKCRAHLEAYQV